MNHWITAVLLLLLACASMAAVDEKGALFETINKIRHFVRSEKEKMAAAAVDEMSPKNGRAPRFEKDIPVATDEVPAAAKPEGKKEGREDAAIDPQPQVIEVADEDMKSTKHSLLHFENGVPTATDQVSGAAKAESKNEGQEDASEPAAIDPQDAEVALEPGLGEDDAPYGLYLLTGNQTCPVDHLIMDEDECLEAGNRLKGWDKTAVGTGTWAWKGDEDPVVYENKYAPCGCFTWRGSDIKLNLFEHTDQCVGEPGSVSIAEGESICMNCPSGTVVSAPRNDGGTSLFCCKAEGWCMDSVGNDYDSVRVSHGHCSFADNTPSGCAAYCAGLPTPEGAPTLQGFAHNEGASQMQCACFYDSFNTNQGFLAGRCTPSTVITR